MDCFSLRPYQVPQNEWSLFGNGSITTSSLPSSHTVYNYSPRSSYTPSGPHIQEPCQLAPPSFSSSMLSSVVLSLMYLQEVCQVLGDTQHCSVLVLLHLVMVDIRSLVWAFQSFTRRWDSQPWDMGVEGATCKETRPLWLGLPHSRISQSPHEVATKSTGEELSSGTWDYFLQHLIRLIFWFQASQPSKPTKTRTNYFISLGLKNLLLVKSGKTWTSYYFTNEETKYPVGDYFLTGFRKLFQDT